MELIHTCYRVTDPERSIAFYEALGFGPQPELYSAVVGTWLDNEANRS